jgi:hypothetical protein
MKLPRLINFDLKGHWHVYLTGWIQKSRIAQTRAMYTRLANQPQREYLSLLSGEVVLSMLNNKWFIYLSQHAFNERVPRKA